jgi:hypothetical protein
MQGGTRSLADFPERGSASTIAVPEYAGRSSVYTAPKSGRILSRTDQSPQTSDAASEIVLYGQ